MKVIIYSSVDEIGLSKERMQIIVDGKTHIVNVHSLCECSEDATIERDLIGCYEILDYMKLAYEAGKAGEPLDIEYMNELKERK